MRRQQLVPRSFAFALAILGLVAAATSQLSAQAPQQKTVWDGVFAADQASRGKALFETNCATCHGETLMGDRGPALVGERFMSSFETDTVRRLFETMRNRMPQGNAGILQEQEYPSLAAFVLQSNAFPAGPAPLTANLPELAAIRIVRKDGPLKEAPNFSLVGLVGCLSQDPANAWIVSNASRPLVTKNPDFSKDVELATATGMALGTDSYKLMLLTVQPGTVAPLKGNKVEAKGLLIRNPQGNSLNVTSVQSVGTTCN